MNNCTNNNSDTYTSDSESSCDCSDCKPKDKKSLKVEFDYDTFYSNYKATIDYLWSLFSNASSLNIDKLNDIFQTCLINCKDFINTRFPELNDYTHYLDNVNDKCKTVIKTADNIRSNIIDFGTNACSDMKFRTYYLKGSESPIKFKHDQFKVHLKMNSPFLNLIELKDNMCINSEIKLFFQYSIKNKKYTEYHKYKYYSGSENEPEKLELVDFTESNYSNISNTKLIIENNNHKLNFFFIGQVNNHNKYAKINIKANVLINYVSFD
jgi:hypothetical protein